MKVLKWIRVVVAVGLFTLVTLFFLGLGGGCGLLEKIQVGPALIGVTLLPSLLIFLGWMLLTCLLGRIFCSMVCPLGILQDILGRIVKLVRPRRRFSPRPERRGFRVAVLVAFVLLVMFQMTSLVSLIEPYGVFGRIATQLLQPVAEWGNNHLADWLGTDGAVVLFKREILVRSVSGFAVAASSLVLLLGLVAWKGRLFCNLVCPVGTILWVASKKSVFQLAIDADKCVKCGLCSGVCKAECLDGKGRMLDNARCVRCFNCIGVCAKGAISLRPAWSLPKSEKKMAEGRREVVLGLAKAAGGLAAAGVILGGRNVLGDGACPDVIVPPGASEDLLRARCTACGLCVAQCPRKVLAPAGFTEFGPLGLMMPKMDFSRGFCDPNCTLCGEVCPTGAILPLTRATKKNAKIGQAAFNRTACLACTEKIPCGLCERRCPQKAIALKEEETKDGEKTVKIQVPVVDGVKCTGCGACENYCPSHAMKVKSLSAARA